MPPRNHIEIDSTMIHHIDGHLLGDGCITTRQGAPSAIYSQHSKIKSALEQYSSELFPIESKIRYVKNREHILNGRIVIASDGWVLYSRTYVELLSQRRRWYGECPHGSKENSGQKHIPKDCSFSPISMYNVFVDDGSAGNHHLALCIQGFDIDCRNFFVERLYEVSDVISWFTKRGDIRITGKNVERFYNYIGECRTLDYYYKWNIESEDFDDDNNLRNPMKCCRLCGVEYPRDLEFFSRQLKSLSSYCKDCKNAINRNIGNDVKKMYRLTYKLKHEQQCLGGCGKLLVRRNGRTGMCHACAINTKMLRR